MASSRPDEELLNIVPPAEFAARSRGSGRLLVLSNRVALPGLVQPGGVASALGDALRQCGGIWLGWSGKRSDERAARHSEDGNIEYRILDLSAEEHRCFYLGFSNRTLWPLLHSRADLLEHHPKNAEIYRRVNRRFAELVAQAARPDDLIWVHDYHFLTIARDLRELGLRNPLGMFLHTPFPSPDLAPTLPNHHEVFGALRAFDLVGVQTHRDADHLRRYLSQTGAPGARMPDLRVFPIGIDPAVISHAAEAATHTTTYQQMRQSLLDRQLVVGVDRLDYSKGLPNRFQAYGQLFRRHPDMLRRVSYLQIAPISRGEVPEYKKLKAKLDALSGSINSEHGDADWVPVRYIARSYKQSALAGFYRAARVGFVTPLRDGMNLVAKEFVAAQDAHDPGVLILSEFAGAAEQMRGSALMVNPFDIAGMADALAHALRMPLSERRQRWERLMAGVQDDNVGAWSRGFVECLSALVRRPPRLAAANADSAAAPGFRERRSAPRIAAGRVGT
jgi:trehalose 6-phosphate synthase